MRSGLKPAKINNDHGPGDASGLLVEDGIAAKKKAIAYLARREHSCLEIRQKLLSSGYAEDLAAAVVADLEMQGLVSDGRFAEAYARYRRLRGFGPVRIRMEMEQKGVASSTCQEVINQKGFDWFVHAENMRIKKFGIDPPVDYKERARQARFLQQRGFSSDQIQHALSGD